MWCTTPKMAYWSWRIFHLLSWSSHFSVYSNRKKDMKRLFIFAGNKNKRFMSPWGAKYLSFELLWELDIEWLLILHKHYSVDIGCCDASSLLCRVRDSARRNRQSLRFDCIYSYISFLSNACLFLCCMQSVRFYTRVNLIGNSCSYILCLQTQRWLVTWTWTTKQRVQMLHKFLMIWMCQHYQSLLHTMTLLLLRRWLLCIWHTDDCVWNELSTFDAVIIVSDHSIGTLCEYNIPLNILNVCSITSCIQQINIVDG